MGGGRGGQEGEADPGPPAAAVAAATTRAMMHVCVFPTAIAFDSSKIPGTSTNICINENITIYVFFVSTMLI